MKCKKCGKELGQKNICPQCGPKKTADDPAAPAAMADSAKGNETRLTEIQIFLDETGKLWKERFDEKFQDRDFDEYQKLFESAEELWQVRTLFLDEIKNAGSSAMAELLIGAVKKLQTAHPDVSVGFARKWFVSLFQQERNRQKQEELDPVERNIVKLRNQFMTLAKEVFGEDFLDYDQHMEVSFIDFGCSRNDQSEFYKQLVKDFGFPLHFLADYMHHDDDKDTLLDAFAVVLARHCPSSVMKKETDEYECVTGFGSNIADKYRTLALTGKKAPSGSQPEVPVPFLFKSIIH